MPLETRAVCRGWWSRNTVSRSASTLESRLLDLEQVRDSDPGQPHHLFQLPVVERRLLGRGLQLHKAAGTGHHQVHVHFRRGIFFVTQIEERLAAQDADTGGGD